MSSKKNISKLALVGSGIKSISHITIETKACISKANMVLFLVNEPVMAEWIEKNSIKSQSLDSIYFGSKQRTESYEAIKNEILNSLKKYEFICVVIYGHPTVFASPGLDAVLAARDMGVIATILPGISAEDCLFSDLSIDPGEKGCYSVEAMDLLIHDKNIEPSSYLVIWQIGMIGNIGMPTKKINSKAIQLMESHLTKTYSLDHEVILYEAAMYPGMSSKIIRFPINELSEQEFSPISTLVIPPDRNNAPNKNILIEMGLA